MTDDGEALDARAHDDACLEAVANDAGCREEEGWADEALLTALLRRARTPMGLGAIRRDLGLR